MLNKHGPPYLSKFTLPVILRVVSPSRGTEGDSHLCLVLFSALGK